MARARAYGITEFGEKNPPRGGGQAKQVFDALREVQPITVSTLASLLEHHITTRQGAQRVVAFYMSTWKKAGMVVEIAEADAESIAPSSDLVTPDKFGEAERPPAEKLHQQLVEDRYEESEADRRRFEGLSNTDAVHQVLIESKTLLSVEELVDLFKGGGKELSKKQIADALRNLTKRNRARLDETGNTPVFGAISDAVHG